MESRHPKMIFLPQFFEMRKCAGIEGVKICSWVIVHYIQYIYRSYTEGSGDEGANVQVTYSGRMELKGLTYRCAG